MLDLQDRMATAIEAEFDDVVAHCSRSVDVVAYFLGLLELARWGILRVSQDDRRSPIVINYSEAAATEQLDALLRGEELT